MNDASIGKTRFRVGGMDCASCATKIENAVSRLPGITEVGISVSAGTMTVSHEGAVPSGEISRQVKALGYSVAMLGAVAHDHKHEHGPSCSHDHAGHDHGHPARHDHDSHDTRAADAGHAHFDLDDGPWWKSRKARLTIACGVALVAAYAIGLLLPQIGHWAFLAALAVGLVPVAQRAFAAAIDRHAFFDRDADDHRGGRRRLHRRHRGSGNGRAAVPHRRTAGRRGCAPRPRQHPWSSRPGAQDGPRRREPA